MRQSHVEFRNIAVRKDRQQQTMEPASIEHPSFRVTRTIAWQPDELRLMRNACPGMDLCKRAGASRSASGTNITAPVTAYRGASGRRTGASERVIELARPMPLRGGKRLALIRPGTTAAASARSGIKSVSDFPGADAASRTGAATQPAADLDAPRPQSADAAKECISYIDLLSTRTAVGPMLRRAIRRPSCSDRSSDTGNKVGTRARLWHSSHLAAVIRSMHGSSPHPLRLIC